MDDIEDVWQSTQSPSTGWNILLVTLMVVVLVVIVGFLIYLLYPTSPPPSILTTLADPNKTLSPAPDTGTVSTERVSRSSSSAPDTGTGSQDSSPAPEVGAPFVDPATIAEDEVVIPIGYTTNTDQPSGFELDETIADRGPASTPESNFEDSYHGD